MAVEQVAEDPAQTRGIGRVAARRPAHATQDGTSAGETGAGRLHGLVLTGLIVLLALLIAVPLLVAAFRQSAAPALSLPPATTPSRSPSQPAGLAPSLPGQPTALPVPAPLGEAPSLPPGPVPANGPVVANGPVRPPAAAPPAGKVAPAPAPPVASPLTAHYSTDQNSLLGLTGYQGKVVVANPGTVPVTGWRVTLTLPAGETVSNVSGAKAQQSGSTVTFTPLDPGTVPGRANVSFTFQVGGLLAGQPTDCRIDSRPCS
jgi:hypothetical protein